MPTRSPHQRNSSDTSTRRRRRRRDRSAPRSLGNRNQRLSHNIGKSRRETKATHEFFENAHKQSLAARVVSFGRWFRRNERRKREGLVPSMASSGRLVQANRSTIACQVMSMATTENFFDPFRKLLCEILHDYERSMEATYGPIDRLSSQKQHVMPCVHQLGWLTPNRGLLWRTLQEAVQDAIDQKIITSMDGLEDYDERENLYQQMLDWTQNVVLTWIEKQVGNNGRPLRGQDMKEWSMRLEKTCAECFCRIRVANVFDIIADYPDSFPAVLELKLVIERTGLQSHLAMALQEALRRRLCHPGANTSQIIDVYISTIKVLRLIDPSDRLLRAVAEPVRHYLRGRADTVRSIIGSLTGTVPSSELYQELRRQDAKPLEDITCDSDDEEKCPTLAWIPPPSIHQPRGSFLEASRTDNGPADGADGDILAMLVSIYGSKELFVNEYRIMLADKLLANLDYVTDQEVHNLELLKLRFGEMSMRSCEVMLKDLNDSKRTNSNIKSLLEGQPTDTVVDAVMLSHIFWPQLHDETMKHHPKMQYMLDIFGKEYARLKNPRVLLWFHHLGTVELEAQVVENGRTVTKEFSCSPLLATLLVHFEDKAAWTAADLSNETSIPEHLIQKRIAFWVSQKVLRLVTTGVDMPTYVLASVDDLSSNQGDEGRHVFQDSQHHHQDATGVSVSAQEEEEMDIYLSYIVGMLTNMGSLPLKTIHNNLKTFVTGSEIRYNKTPQQLSAFLQRLCQEERLECGPDGMYKLYKS